MRHQVSRAEPILRLKQRFGHFKFEQLFARKTGLHAHKWVETDHQAPDKMNYPQTFRNS